MLGDQNKSPVPRGYCIQINIVVNKIILKGILSSELIFKEVLEHVWLCFLCDDMDKVMNDHQLKLNVRNVTGLHRNYITI